jgi:TonB family protein
MKTFLVSLLVALCFMAETRAVAAPELQGSSPAAAGRPSNEAVFDRNKGAIYALYGRALRDQPSLSGTIVFEIDIGATGVVSTCRVKSSQLRAPDFERTLCERIRQFRFAPQTPTTFTKELTLISAA